MRTIILILLAFSLNACIPDIEGDVTNNDYDTSTTTTSSIYYAEGELLFCSLSECTVAPAETDPADSDAIVGVYDAEYTQVECNSAGFFYCTVENICLDQPLDGGSCI